MSEGFIGYKPVSLFDELSRCGALREGEDRLVADEATVRAYLAYRAAHPLHGDRLWTSTFGYRAFVEGRLLALSHGSYLSLALPHSARFDWSLEAMPLGANGRSPMPLMSAGVRRDTPYLAEALDLARAFCGEEFQHALAVLHGMRRSCWVMLQSTTGRCRPTWSSTRRGCSNRPLRWKARRATNATSGPSPRFRLASSA